MNSSGDNLAGHTLAELRPFGWHKRSTGLFVSRLSTRCVVPSRQGVPELEHDLPGSVGLHALVGTSGARRCLQRPEPVSLVSPRGHCHEDN